MDEFEYSRLRAAAVLIILLSLGFGACKVDVNQFEKYRNRPNSEQMFVDWMLEPEATPEVRAKAIEMLFEQFNQEGWRYLPRVGDLSPSLRHQAIRDALPHIRSLYTGENPCRIEEDCQGFGRCQEADIGACADSGTNCLTADNCDGEECIMTRCLGVQFNLGTKTLFRLPSVRVRDGVIMLLEVTEDEQTREQLIEIVHQWIRDHYTPCVTTVGRHPASRICEVLKYAEQRSVEPSKSS